MTDRPNYNVCMYCTAHPFSGISPSNIHTLPFLEEIPSITPNRAARFEMIHTQTPFPPVILSAHQLRDLTRLASPQYWEVGSYRP